MMLPSRAASNLPNPQTVAQPSLKMHAALRGFTRQNFIWNSREDTDISQKQIKYESRIIVKGIHVC